MEGIFISIEGMDGSGKTTQINKLKDFFEKKGQHVIITREPGGTIISEAIRNIILDINYSEMDSVTEMLLYAASRAQHVREYIVPCLKKGDIVICDRYIDSSIVYQGYARGLGEEMVRVVNTYATGGLMPDITFFLDLEHTKGMSRKKDQQELDRLEAEKEKFHQMVREGYHILLEGDEKRLIGIDAGQSIELVHEAIIEALIKWSKMDDNHSRGSILLG